MGYISSFADQINSGNPVHFILSTVHPDRVILSEGYFNSTTSQAPLASAQLGPVAQQASVGIVSRSDDFIAEGLFFATWIPPGDPNGDGLDWEVRAFEDTDYLVADFRWVLMLSLFELETPDGAISGRLEIPNLRESIPINILSVKDHHSKGIVLYGLDGNGAAVNILLRT